MHRADIRIVCVAFARGLGRDELQAPGRRKIWFVLLGARGATAGGKLLRRPAPTAGAEIIRSSCELRQTSPYHVSVLRLRGGWGETSCTSSRKAQNLVCPFHRQVPRRQVPQLIVIRFSPANCTERTLALSVMRLRGGWGETSCTSSRKAQNLVCPFHRQVPRRQVPQLIVFASALQIAHQRTLALSSVAFARGLGRDELHKLQEGAKSGLSFSPPEVPRRQVPQRDRLRFSPAKCTERTLALSVLRLRGGWGETSCTSSRTAQNLVCPFHRQVPRRQVPQLIAFASAQQIAQSGHSHCLCCVCAGAGARRAAQAP